MDPVCFLPDLGSFSARISRPWNFSLVSLHPGTPFGASIVGAFVGEDYDNGGGMILLPMILSTEANEGNEEVSTEIPVILP